MKAWCITLPVNTLVLIPSNQGSQPASMIALLMIALIAIFHHSLPQEQLRRYVRDWIILIIIWILFFSASQLAHLLNGMVPIENLNLIRNDSRILVRPQLFTQSIYLVACFSIFTFFRHFLPVRYVPYIFYGVWFMVLYGLYEWVFFLVFKRSGDFLANRVFDSDMKEAASWTQGVELGGTSVMRIKSTFGEPSFFTAACVPFLFISFLTRRMFLGTLCLLCMILSWSTTAFAAIFACIIMMGVAIRHTRRAATYAFFAAFLALGAFAITSPEFFDQMFRAKIVGDNDSGRVRKEIAVSGESTMEQLSLLQKAVGIGYGYVYANVAGAIRINMGYLGLILFLWFFLWPYISATLQGTSAIWPLGAAIICVLYVINVAELYLPTTWAILGMAWRSIDLQGNPEH